MLQRSIAIAFLSLCTGALMIAATVLLVQESTPTPIQIQAPEPTVAPPPTESPSVQVHIAGAVTRPGVYVMAAGNRLVDALERAGGPIEGADLDAINLAQSLVDAQRYYIPLVGEVAAASLVDPMAANAGRLSTDPPPALERIDLNDSTADVLATLPGIGPTKAQNIINYRVQHGPFESTQELMEVPGIGPGIFSGLKDLVTVGP